MQTNSNADLNNVTYSILNWRIMTPCRKHYTIVRRTIYRPHEYYIVVHCISMQWRYPQTINWTINLARMRIVQRTKYCKIKSYLVVNTADTFKQNCVSMCIHIVDIFCSKTEPPFSHFMCDVLFTNVINIYIVYVASTMHTLYLFILFACCYVKFLTWHTLVFLSTLYFEELVIYNTLST